MTFQARCDVRAADGGNRPAHIAVMAVPLHGHVNPTLGLVSELARRGHRITFVTTVDFAPLVEQAGARALCYESTFPSVRAPNRHWLDADDDGRQAVAAFRAELVSALPQIESAMTTDRPDLVVYDTNTDHGRLLAQRWGVPAIELSPTHVLSGSAATPAGQQSSGQQSPALVTIPRSLQFNADQVPANYRFVGPMLTRRTAHGTWQPPTGRRVLLVSLGSTYNKRPGFFRSCAAAFAGTGWHVVLATGHFFDPAVLGTLPCNVEAHPWVPQMAVLAHASAFVTAAGTGSTLEGLLNGVPLVAVPQAVEQFVTAQRIAELGLGRVVPAAEASAQRLRDTVCTVAADTGIAHAVERIRYEIACSGGAAEAADIVEGRLETR